MDDAGASNMIDLETLPSIIACFLIDLVPNFSSQTLELVFCGALSDGPHDCAQLAGGDGAAALLVEQGEGLLKLLLSQLARHGHFCCATDSKEEKDCFEAISEAQADYGLLL